MSENIALFIKKFGGPSAVAARISVDGESPSPAAVTMWAQRNEVPWRWREAFNDLRRASKKEAA